MQVDKSSYRKVETKGNRELGGRAHLPSDFREGFMEKALIGIFKDEQAFSRRNQRWGLQAEEPAGPEA